MLQFLRQLDVPVVEFNPLSVSLSRKSGTLRKTKTDKNDARYIAELLVSTSPNSYLKPYDNITELKSITRGRYRLVKEIQPIKNRYRRSVYLIFPELEGFFSSLYTNSALAILKELPSAKEIASCNILKLTKLLSAASHGRHKRTTAEKLKDLAKNSIAHYNRGDSFELKLLIDQIVFLENQKLEYEKEIAFMMSNINSPITSIPGIGVILGAIILAEIGNIENFASPAKLLAFAGAEPSTYQSGNYTATKTPMVKRGSKYLRNALYLAASSSYIHSSSFNAYIVRKEAQGKHHYTALSHGIKKMTRVIFCILTTNLPFVERI